MLSVQPKVVESVMNESIQNIAIDANIIVDRRSGKDRRKNRFNLFHRPFASGRRRSMRRQADRRRFYLFDYYSPKIFFAVTLVLLLSVVDALLTLWLIGEGAQELNPVMAYFLNFGPNAFMAAKYLITSASVVIVVLFNYILIQRIHLQMVNLLHFFAGCFAAVVIWELVLFARYVL